MKVDVILLTCVFEKFKKVRISEFEIILSYIIYLPGYTWQCVLKKNNCNVKTLQDKDIILLLENNISGGTFSVMGDREIKSDDKKKILHVDATNLYGHSMSQSLPYDEIKFDRNVKLEDILNTPDSNDNIYFVEVDLSYPDNIKEKTKIFPFFPGYEIISKNDFAEYMKKIKPKVYMQHKNLICGWTD